jgi:hypothetical protein
LEAKRSGWPAIHLLETDLAKSVDTLLCPYICPPTAEDSATHTTCRSPNVKVLV